MKKSFKLFFFIKIILVVLALTFFGIKSQSQNSEKCNKEVKMTGKEVMVIYKWTAKEGKEKELKGIYEEVKNEMKSNEPGALKVHCYFDKSTRTLVVIDLFANHEAVGFHLGTTANKHFEQLLTIATPGEFIFCGDVPEELKQNAIGMGLQATFASKIFGFSKD